MIGDSESDIKAGQAAGCKTVLIYDGEEVPCYGQTEMVRTVLEFVAREEIL